VAKIPVALQLYTVRDMTEKDFLGTLKQVAGLGYTAVEFAGTGNVTAADMRRALDDLGMKAAGMHVGFEDVTDASRRPKMVKYARTIGCKSFALSGNRESAEAWRQFGLDLARAGVELAKDGVTLSFHNHSAEFKLHNCRPGLEIMYEVAEPRFLKAQVDVYWVRHAGQDPAAFIRQHAGRCPTVHCKDMEKGDERFFAEVGEGILDWPGIFQACETVGGTEWYVVEQDQCRRPSIESARISLANLKKWGKV
jgi:sugar phosphate isomerase/epimerase